MSTIVNNDTKKRVNLVAEKCNWKVSYDWRYMVVSSGIKRMHIRQANKYTARVNAIEEDLQIEDSVLIENIIDYIHNFMTGQHSELAYKSPGELITINLWISEEGEHIIDGVKNAARKSEVYKELGGNRFIAEYYKEAVIILDDLLWYKSNSSSHFSVSSV